MFKSIISVYFKQKGFKKKSYMRIIIKGVNATFVLSKITSRVNQFTWEFSDELKIVFVALKFQKS